jgi:hypothetical protein
VDDQTQGYHFFVADFGGVDLTPGQYTVYIHNATASIQVVAETGNPYSGGEYVSDQYGNYNGADATFFTPAPIPEPS